MLRQEIKNLIGKAIKELYKTEAEVLVERPENKEYGDYSTNIALLLKKNPQEIANTIKSPVLEKVEVKNGFINFFVSEEYLQKQVSEILKQKESFGQLKIGRGRKINVEFCSANPNGPLHVGNARGGFCGDVLSNVLAKAGYKPYREYYVNDRGRQIKFLKDTLEGNIVYKNEYTEELIRKGEKNVKKAVNYIVGRIKKTTERMGIKFDKWFFESDLYPKEVNQVLDFLKKNNLIYEKEDAVWFKSTQFGDDKDRVLVRAQEKTTYEEETYLLSDVAYLKNKFKRGFENLVIFLGAEHHGYINRLKAAAEALGFSRDRVKPIVFQLVRLIEDGHEVKMSKRTGNFVTIDELIDEVGLDAARFFFLSRAADTHLNFDLALAKEQSEKNPVYYVQYAHTRICGILRKFGKFEIRNPKSLPIRQAGEILKLLTHPSESSLIKELIRLPEIIEDTAKDYQVQRLPKYATDLAVVFHQFYRDCRVISENKELTQARLALTLATQIVLKNALGLMGISAPEKM